MDNKALFTITDPNIHLRQNWNSHVQTDGSNIGGVPPLHYGMVRGLAGNPGSTLFYTEGSSVPGGYADCEFYTSRPVMPNTGNLSLTVQFAVDENHAVNAQALELDTILCLGGYNYNGSLQINNAEEGMVQIAKADGGWVDTGFKVDVAPNKAHVLVVLYGFDSGKKVSSVVSVGFDGDYYPISPTLQNIPAQQKNWSDGAIFQVQLDLNKLAGNFSVRMDDAHYDWW
jgi:hypothetical protein